MQDKNHCTPDNSNMHLSKWCLLLTIKRSSKDSLNVALNDMGLATSLTYDFMGKNNKLNICTQVLANMILREYILMYQTQDKTDD